MFSFVEVKRYIFLGILAALALIGLLVVTNLKGKWVCEKGAWVAKGNPQVAKPTAACY